MAEPEISIQPVYSGSLLVPGDTVWRTETADRFSILMENDRYFSALSSAIGKAQKSIVVLGWQFDPRTRLDPHSGMDDRSEDIGHKLRMLVRTRPELDVRLLIWHSPLLIAASQGFYPHKAQRWFRKRMVEFRLDQPGPLGACHHQKVVIIDDKVAFCGGGDISTDRWDTEQHQDDDPRRCMPSGIISAPRHETMAVVSGPAAKALGDLARERWFRATWERTLPDQVATDPWPDDVEVQMRDVKLGIARTEPRSRGRAEVRENERLHLDSIRRARKLIYLENQYFTSPAIAAALAERLKEPDGPEVILVSTGNSPSWFDKMTMDTARSEVLYRLESADQHQHFFAFTPQTQNGTRIIVHAKVTIIDDQLLRIGSTNLNNRSMGLDTECDIAVEPETAVERVAIRRFRHQSIAHFLGVDAADVARAEQALGSTGRAIESYRSERLKPLGAVPPSSVERFIAEWQLGDPSSADNAWRPWKRRNPSQRRAAGEFSRLRER